MKGTKARRTQAGSSLAGLDLTAASLRAVSIRQPYAELILRGDKTEEYRTWRVSHGPLLIHASRTVTADEREEAEEAGIDLSQVPTGALIGLVHVNEIEGEEGDYAWQLARPIRFSKPVPYQGAASIMRVSMDVVRGSLSELQQI